MIVFRCDTCRKLKKTEQDWILGMAGERALAQCRQAVK